MKVTSPVPSHLAAADADSPAYMAMDMDEDMAVNAVDAVISPAGKRKRDGVAATDATKKVRRSAMQSNHAQAAAATAAATATVQTAQRYSPTAVASTAIPPSMAEQSHRQPSSNASHLAPAKHRLARSRDEVFLDNSPRQSGNDNPNNNRKHQQRRQRRRSQSSTPPQRQRRRRRSSSRMSSALSAGSLDVHPDHAADDVRYSRIDDEPIGTILNSLAIIAPLYWLFFWCKGMHDQMVL